MIENIIDLVRDGRDQHRSSEISGIMIHRVGIDLRQMHVLGFDAISICDAFLGRVDRWRDVAKATGGQNAYTFYVGGNLGSESYDGRVWQALPLGEVGHHARRFSRPYIGIGCIGDFREEPPSEAQRLAVIDLCADLCGMLDLDASRVVGHGEILGAHNGSKAPGAPAACPGDLFDIEQLRHEVSVVMQAKGSHAARKRLRNLGLVF